MKLDAADFPKLQHSLLVALLMIALGAMTVFFSFDWSKAASADLTTAQRERNEFDGKLRQVRNEESEIKQKAELFRTLQARGMVGTEPRLEWVELLKGLRDKHRLIELHYELAPQRPLEPVSSGKIGLFASAMRLQLKLLHEEDLTRLLGDLKQHASALIQVRRCDVSRLGRSAAEPTTQALLQADCVLDWITLRDTGKK